LLSVFKDLSIPTTKQVVKVI